METILQILELKAPLWQVLCCALFSIAMMQIYDLFTRKHNWSLTKKKAGKVVKLKTDWKPLTKTVTP